MAKLWNMKCLISFLNAGFPSMKFRNMFVDAWCVMDVYDEILYLLLHVRGISYTTHLYPHKNTYVWSVSQHIHASLILWYRFARTTLFCIQIWWEWISYELPGGDWARWWPWSCFCNLIDINACDSTCGHVRKFAYMHPTVFAYMHLIPHACLHCLLIHKLDEIHN